MGYPRVSFWIEGLQFIAELMRELNRILGIKSKISMVFHSQTDGQMERVN